MKRKGFGTQGAGVRRTAASGFPVGLYFSLLKKSFLLLFAQNHSDWKYQKARMNTELSALMRALILAEKERFELSRRLPDLLP